MPNSLIAVTITMSIIMIIMVGIIEYLYCCYCV